jgi:FixJ family two-component response regulator
MRLAGQGDLRLRQRHASLEAREREVLAGLAAGKLNKQIAPSWELPKPRSSSIVPT